MSLHLEIKITKVTISLSSESVAYFKDGGKKTSYAVSKDDTAVT